MERWTTVKQLHQATLERAATERAAFLDDACAGDEGLRREVESLLAYEDAAAPFMESPALQVAARDVSAAPAHTLVGRTLSHYQVQSLLGAGGITAVRISADTPRTRSAIVLLVEAAE